MKFSKVTIIVGEGKTEKIFLRAFLMRVLELEEYENTSRECITFVKGSELYIFAHPTLGKSYSGGVSILQKEATWIAVNSRIDSYKHLFTKNVIIRSLTFTDVDDRDDKAVTELKSIIIGMTKKYCRQISECKIWFSNRMIESWFIAGIPDNFPNLKKKITPKDLISLRNDAERYQDPNPKDKLKEIITLSGGQEIASAFGEYLDNKLACQNSPSFKNWNDYMGLR